MSAHYREKEQHVVLVDNDDNVIGTMEKLKAHQQGLCHRAFSVFIFRNVNGTWQCLLQQRQQHKYHCAGLWTNTCCSHPLPDEDTDVAAKRRLQEEMGFVVPLHYVDTFHYIADVDNGLTENEIDHVFIGFFAADTQINVNPEEVADFAWVDVATLPDDINKQPTHYTPWLLRALAIATAGLNK